MDKREQLRQSLMYYMRLHYTNQKTLKTLSIYLKMVFIYPQV